MNYLLEIKAFYDWLETNSIPTSAIALWHALMHIGNKTGWKEQFAVAQSVLEIKTGLCRKTLQNARNQLKQAGRIDFESRNGSQSALYSILPFVGNDSPQNSPQPGAQCSPQPGAQCSPQPGAQCSPQPGPIIKLNKTKQNPKGIPNGIPAQSTAKHPSKPVKNAHGENKNVWLSDQEYAKLADYCGGEALRDRYISRLSGYLVQIAPKKARDNYHDHYATIQNWVRRDKDEGVPKGGTERDSGNGSAQGANHEPCESTGQYGTWL